MNKRTKLLYTIVLLTFAILYSYLECAMFGSKGGLGLGVYLFYLGALFVHIISLIVIYIVGRVRRQTNNVIAFYINVFVVVILLLRLFVFIYI